MPSSPENLFSNEPLPRFLEKAFMEQDHREYKASMRRRLLNLHDLETVYIMESLQGKYQIDLETLPTSYSTPADKIRVLLRGSTKSLKSFYAEVNQLRNTDN